MSGICGVAFRDGNRKVDAELLCPMVRSLDATGPGEGARECFGPVGLAAQEFPGRLAGVVRETRHGDSLGLAFHGSIYNLQELAPGRVSASSRLVELLSVFKSEGIGFVRRLRGEFALAFWDGSAETIYAATDRFRVHPLFYYIDETKLVFGSRMKTILTSPFPVTSCIHLQSVIDVVASSYIPSPNTIFVDVKKLPAGHILSYRRGELKISPYWDIDFTQPSSEDEAMLAQKCRDKLSDSVAIRLRGDQPEERVGTFLSGGVDSSTVTGLITRLTNLPVKTFSIGFEEQQFNEINYARIAGSAFGAEQHEYFVTPADVLNAIPLLLDSFDEPFANASAIPTYYCAKLARERGINFLYAGDGGDELFAGNERYATQRLFDYYHNIPAWLRRTVVEPAASVFGAGVPWNVFDKARKYIRRANIPYPERLSSYGLFETVSLETWFDDDLLTAVGKNYDPYAAVEFHYFKAPAHRELDRQLYIDLKLAISDNDLFKVTRMTEAAGVAVRYPFLDHCVAEFAATVPARLKMRGLKLRTFFKNAYAGLLPEAVLAKQKHGFGLPIPVWLRTDGRLNEMMRDLVLSPRSLQRGYFKRKAVEDLVERHGADRSSFYGAILWNLMILELWHRKYSELPGVAPKRTS